MKHLLQESYNQLLTLNTILNEDAIKYGFSLFYLRLSRIFSLFIISNLTLTKRKTILAVLESYIMYIYILDKWKSLTLYNRIKSNIYKFLLLYIYKWIQWLAPFKMYLQTLKELMDLIIYTGEKKLIKLNKIDWHSIWGIWDTLL